MIRFLSIVLLAVWIPGVAAAYTHIARSGETLERLAVKYFGKPALSVVIRAANGFVHPDDGSLTPGERVEIPEVTYHQIQAGETWTELADRYLGSPMRGVFLADMNRYSDGSAPVKGEIVRVPYQLLHILAADESLRSVTRLYFDKTRSHRWLRRYNLTEKKKFGRGEGLLVPLIDVDFVTAERDAIQAERNRQFNEKDRENQLQAATDIARLKMKFVAGKYVQLVAIANRLMGNGDLTIPQEIGVYQFLAFAYVALNQNEMAIDYFTKALKLQPTMDLSPITTSPKIIAVFHKAQKGVLLDAIADSLDGGATQSARKPAPESILGEL